MFYKFALGSIVYYNNLRLGQQPKRVLWVDLRGREPNYLLEYVTRNGTAKRCYRLESKLTDVSPAVTVLTDRELPTKPEHLYI